MSTATTAAPPAGRRAAAGPAPRLTFLGVLRGEWIKLLSLRSTWWTLAVTVVVMALFALAQAASLEVLMDPEFGGGGPVSIHGAEVITGGYQFAMVTVAVLGALAMTGEYSTGMIRSTLAAVPTRLPVLAAKAIILVGLTVVVAAVGIAVSALVTAPMLAEHDLVPAMDDPDTWQVFGGTVYFLVAVALFALGLGAVLRHSAGTITAVLGALLLLPMILQFISLDWVQDALAYLPLPAATAFVAVSEMLAIGDGLSPWQGVAVLGGYAVLALVAGAVLLRRRDA
ncbi:ABC transporter permease subunit [Georgenia sp. TF02-10]|uniref:ABC transporter permease subunit n=1 Tax=Georgenia sp. TF02-10 TaxID=2917725 RepID=UPI001FA6CC58|nr:ABC transporter permease subunit [Georgenia sp. TF02-10]UNX55610.1 ABC transporter permease subunit [Georgenia sp. TF02-10]